MTIKGICRPLRSILIAKGEQEDNNWISAEILQDYPPLGGFFFFLSPAHSSFCVASLAWRGLLFMSAYYWVDKMDHLVSSLILSPSFFFAGSSQAKKPSALWKPAMWHLAASASPQGQKGRGGKEGEGEEGTLCTFNGNAENQQRFTQHPPSSPSPPWPLQRVSGWCERLWGRSGASGGVWAWHVSPEVKAAKPKVCNEQKDFPLDERVQTLRSETREESRRSVWHEPGAAEDFKWSRFHSFSLQHSS